MKHIISTCLLVLVGTLIFADSTVIQPITYGAPVKITINLTPNQPLALPLMVGTTHCRVIVPDGARVKVGEVEAKGTYDVPSLPATLDVYDADRVTVVVEESK